jgi:hypothetical protein
VRRAAGLLPNAEDVLVTAEEDELRTIVTRGAALVSGAEAVVREAREMADRGSELGRRGHEIAAEYFHLRQWLARLPATPTTEQVGQALNFEQQMVDQALVLAYRPDSPDKQRLADHFGDADSAPTRRLLELARAYCRGEDPATADLADPDEG